MENIISGFSVSKDCDEFPPENMPPGFIGASDIDMGWQPMAMEENISGFNDDDGGIGQMDLHKAMIEPYVSNSDAIINTDEDTQNPAAGAGR